MEAFAVVGLGLDDDDLALERTPEAWLAAGGDLRDRIADELGALAVQVEQIGSSSVVGLLAKPIIDMAAGTGANVDLAEVTRRLEGCAWIYEGDAGDGGGHVFVLETRPRHRVAHLHVVEHGGRQWVDYLRLRGLLRRDLGARARYEAVKLELAQNAPGRVTYQAGKAEVIDELLTRAQRRRL